MINRQSRPIRLYVAEEQEIYRNLYDSLSLEGSIDILKVSTGGLNNLSRDLSVLNPDALLVSAKRSDSIIIKEMDNIRRANPDMATIFLLAFYNVQDVELLRRIAINGKKGMALFLKPSLDSSEQLCSIIEAVCQGHIILDPAFNSLLAFNSPEYPFLKQLTPREAEILDLLANGYTNDSIAHKLFVDLKTVEHHINNLYGKLKSTPNFSNGHPRVSAARLYLEAKGELLSLAHT